MSDPFQKFCKKCFGSLLFLSSCIVQCFRSLCDALERWLDNFQKNSFSNQVVLGCRLSIYMYITFNGGNSVAVTLIIIRFIKVWFASELLYEMLSWNILVLTVILIIMWIFIVAIKNNYLAFPPVNVTRSNSHTIFTSKIFIFKTLKKLNILEWVLTN